MAQPVSVAQSAASSRPFARKSLRDTMWRVIAYVCFSLVGLVLLLPFFWMVSTSLKESGTEFAYPPQWFPVPPHPENYQDAMTLLPFMTFLKNTLIITFVNMAGGMLTASMAGYGFARLRFPFRNQLFLLCLATMMLPSVATLIPQFIIFKTLNWINTFLPLTVPSFFGGGAFFIFLTRQFFMSIPYELEEAARIDGANSWRIFFQLMLPLSGPVLAAMAIFSFQSHWNEFLTPLIYLNDREKYTLAIGLNSMHGLYQTNWNMLMAASAATTLPMIVLFFAAQRHFMKGIVTTGLGGR